MSEINKAKVEEFSGRMLDVLSHAFLALMTSIGHQTGLFEVMTKLAPSTSEEIARAAGLNERYVREWLGAMVTARVVEYDPAQHRYHLPAEHGAALTKAAGSGNLATLMQFVSCMGNVEQGIVECFRKGGGLPYSAYGRFHDIMKAVSGQTFEETLIDRTLPLVPGLVDRLANGIEVLDIGCGAGRAINLMARQFPKSRFTGYDFSLDAIAAAREESRAQRLKNTRFEMQDVAALPEEKAYDLITAFDSIHDQAKPRDVLRAIARALCDDGTFLMVDIDASSKLEKNLERPLTSYFYAISTMHCMSVSLGLNGEGLGTVWGEEKARELLAEAGFSSVDVRRIEGDIINCYYIAKKR